MHVYNVWMGENINTIWETLKNKFYRSRTLGRSFFGVAVAKSEPETWKQLCVLVSGVFIYCYYEIEWLPYKKQMFTKHAKTLISLEVR